MGEALDPPSIVVQAPGAWFNVIAAATGVFVRMSSPIEGRDGLMLTPELAELLGRALIVQARSSRRRARRRRQSENE